MDRALAALAGDQHGLVTYAQCRALGLSPSAISRRSARGALHRVYPKVYAVGHPGLSRHGRWMAAVLAAGEGAALGYLAAARLWEGWRRKVERIDVVVPSRRHAPRGVALHSCRRLDPRDVTTRDGIPVTTVARTLVDLSDVLTPHQLANVIHEAAFRRRFALGATCAAMGRAHGRHRLGVLEAALELHTRGSAGTRSALEDSFLDLVAEAGLPEPLVNIAVPGEGRTFEVDFHWPGSRLCVEVDGPGHRRARTRREDRARDRALRAAGHRVLRFGDEDVERRGERVAAAVRTAGGFPAGGG